MDGGRRKRRPAKPAEIAAAVGVVLAGVAVIAAIVLVDPRWPRIFASWRDGVAAAPSVMGISPPAIRPDGLQLQQATVGSPEAIPRAARRTRLTVPSMPTGGAWPRSSATGAFALDNDRRLILSTWRTRCWIRFRENDPVPSARWAAPPHPKHRL